MDMSKAFDMVEWVSLFKRLMERKISFIILRLMLYIYEHQSCAVKWSGQVSSPFTISNGVRQGAVSSAILFAIYIDELLILLKDSRLGCHIDGVFLGAFLFADVILLLSASRQEFHFVSPPTLMSLVNSFATSFYGSSLWNLQSKECDRIYNPWNVMIRRALNIDYKTHRFLNEPLSKQCHLKTSLLSRYVNFYKGLINSPKFPNLSLPAYRWNRVIVKVLCQELTVGKSLKTRFFCGFDLYC